MQITIQLDGDNAQHLLALAALIEALGATAPSPFKGYVPPLTATLAPDGFPTPPMRGNKSPIIYADESASSLAADLPPPTAATIIPPPPPAPEPTAVSVPVPPAPVVVVPPPPAGNIAAPASDGDVDKFGIKWDARIHSDTRGVNKDGSWRKRRNLDDAEYERVMQELRIAHAATVSPTPTSGVSVPVPPPPPAAVTVSDTPAVTSAASSPPPGKAPAGAVTDPEGWTFQQTLQHATKLGHVYASMNAVIAANIEGATEMKHLINRPDDWPYVRMLLDANAPEAQ